MEKLIGMLRGLVGMGNFQMHKEKILKLADIVEKLEYSNSLYDPGKFCMTEYMFHCGAPACIAGWTVLAENQNWDLSHIRGNAENRLVPVNIPPYQMNRWIHERAQAILGLDNFEASVLFAPRSIDLSEITPQLAARTLRNFVETGWIEWLKCLEEERA